MRTTIELPDELLTRAKLHAAQNGTSIKDLFIDALNRRLAMDAPKTRRQLPKVGGPDAPSIGILTAEQIDEAMFG